jgi:hypothetical protein
VLKILGAIVLAAILSFLPGLVVAGSAAHGIAAASSDRGPITTGAGWD